MDFQCQLSIRCFGAPEEWGGARGGVVSCSDEKLCQQVLDGKWCPRARPADVQATWLPEICSLKQLFRFVEDAAKART